MRSRFLIASVAGAALVMACKDDTPVYSGGTPGGAVALAITQAAFVFRQNDTSSIAGQLTDSAGNIVTGTATIASCNASIATVASGTAPTGWAALSTIKAVGVGHTCITVTAGSFVDTALVDVGPYKLTLTGPAAAKSGIAGVNDRSNAGVPSVPYVFKVAAFDSTGAAITTPFFRTWTTQTDQTLFTPLSKNGVADSVLVVSPGKTGTIRVTVQALGGATASATVVVGDGDFTGTVASGNVLTRPGLDTIVITRNAAGGATSTSPVWNATAANQVYTVGGVQTFARQESAVSSGVQSWPLTPTNNSTKSAVIVVPPLGVAAGTALPVRITTISSTSITQTTTAANPFTTNNSTGIDGGSPANLTSAAPPNFTIPSCGTAAGNICGGAPPATFNIDPIAQNFTVLFGPCTAGTGTPKSVATGVAGTNCDDWLQITNGLATTRSISVNLAWFSNADVDLYVYQADGTTLITQANTAGGTSETVGFSLTPNQVVKIRANLQNQGSNANAPVVTGGTATSRGTLVRWQLTVNNN